jgi:uncharacterized membrane protein
MTATIISTIVAAFLASFVEVVEAFTIVLAVGLTRGWRPAFAGTGLGLLLLVLLVVAFGPLLALIPIHIVQFVVGVLLILFGTRWLRKAILRSVGVIPLHDEDKAFAAETAELKQLRNDRRADYVAGLAAFKAVVLEGIEVIFIVIAVGTTQGLTFYAGLGALAAFVVVLAVGLAIHHPLSRVPENTLKFTVGLMLTSFGIFWTGEGLGVEWPGADLALLAILAVLVAAALGLRFFVSSTRSQSQQGAAS